MADPRETARALVMAMDLESCDGVDRAIAAVTAALTASESSAERGTAPRHHEDGTRCAYASNLECGRVHVHGRGSAPSPAAQVAEAPPCDHRAFVDRAEPICGNCGADIVGGVR